MNSQHEPIAAKFMSPGKVVSQSEQFDQVCHFCNHTRHSPVPAGLAVGGGAELRRSGSKNFEMSWLAPK